MIAFDVFPKVLAHGCIAVGSLDSLEYNGCIFKGNMLYSCKITLSVNPMFCKQLILSLTADGHDLAEKLLHAKAVKISVSFFFQGMDFLALTCRIQYLFACFYFICFLIISVRSPRNAKEPKAMITSSFPARR